MAVRTVAKMQLVIGICCSAMLSLACKQAFADNKLPPDLADVGIDQKLGAPLPLDVIVRDETGNQRTFGSFLGKKPTVLVFVQYECPMLCNLVLNGLVDSLRRISFVVGNEFDVVVVGFDPKETPELAQAKKEAYVQKYARWKSDDGWHFLTAEQPAIDQLTKAAGFRYRFNATTKRYAHASGIMIVTPEGKLARYFYGVQYAPRDLRLGLVEASQNKIGSLADQVLLFCYGYDPQSGRYTPLILNILRIASVLTILVLGGGIVWMIRREGRANAAKVGALGLGAEANPGNESRELIGAAQFPKSGAL